MVCYNLYIFNRDGVCLHYTEWSRPKHVKDGAGTLVDDAKMMFGLLFSLKNVCTAIDPTRCVRVPLALSFSFASPGTLLTSAPHVLPLLLLLLRRRLQGDKAPARCAYSARRGVLLPQFLDRLLQAALLGLPERRQDRPQHQR